MLAPADLISLPYAPEFTRAGLEHLCRQLPYWGANFNKLTHDRMRQAVAQSAAELAFNRLLTQKQVPFHMTQTARFAEPNRFDLNLGGRRCQIINTMIASRKRIRELRRDPGALLGTSVLCPSQELQTNAWDDQDLVVYSIITALTTSDRRDLERALAAGQPSFLINILPHSWREANHFIYGKPTQPVSLKSEASKTILLELGGVSRESTYQCEHIPLPPLLRVEAHKEFANLAYAHIDQLPDGRIAIHHADLAQTLTIQPERWANLWLYGIEVIVIGYVTRGQCKRRSQTFQKDMRVTANTAPARKNRYLPIKQLRPIEDLFTRVKDWAATSKP